MRSSSMRRPPLPVTPRDPRTASGAASPTSGSVLLQNRENGRRSRRPFSRLPTDHAERPRQGGWMSMSAYLPAGACRGTILRAVLMLGAVIVLLALDAGAGARAEGLW